MCVCDEGVIVMMFLNECGVVWCGVVWLCVYQGHGHGRQSLVLQLLLR